MRRASVLLVVTLSAALAGVARAGTWADFESAFPTLPCHDGWMGCVVGGHAISPDLGSAPADMRVGWFDLEPTAAFSPFVGLSEYQGGPVEVASVDVADPPVVDAGGGNDGVAMAAPPSEDTQRAREAADLAAADAAAAAASQAEARRQAQAAEEARRAAEAEEKRRREEEARMRKEADRLARQAQQAAAAAQADEQARLAREAEEARKRAADAEAARLAAEEASRKQREAEEEARRKAEEEQRRMAEAEAARLAAEEEARRKAEEERQRQLAAEEEARRKQAEADAAAAAEQARLQAEAEEKARLQAEAEAAGNDNDGSAVVDPEAPMTPAPPVADGDCSDLTTLEPSAMLGKLSDGQIGCLEQRLASTPKMTDKEKVSLVLMANSWSKGDKQTWENLVKRHLDEIDQSDPDLCYKYALHLSRQGSGRASGVIRWANVALENRTVWTGDTYTSRVYSLYKLRAAASQMMWKSAEEDHAASPSDETRDKVDKYRNMTKVNAREWYEYAKSAGKDPTTALHLCMSAAGTKDYCEAG